MSPRRVQHENHERWLVSYADFITLLFAFFVVMFAASQADKGKARQVSESVKRALEEGQIASKVAGILGGAPGETGKGNAMMRGPGGAERATAELAPSLEQLTAELKSEIDAGKLRIRLDGRGLTISLAEAAFFASGEDRVAPDTHEALATIARAIAKLPNPVRLEGHTDSVPIHNSRFRSNWELSAARSVAVLELLRINHGIPAARMAIAGYADTTPVDTNDTPEGRARNRRVDIVILSRLAQQAEPEKPH